jgi:hypothetical protein
VTATDHRAGAGYAHTDTHVLLLGLAGRVPDEALAEMRLRLADGEMAELASLLAVRVAGLTLTETEAEVVRALTGEATPGVGAPSTLPYRFGDRHGVPPVPGRDVPADAMDEVVVEAGTRVGGLVALWRVFRHASAGPPERVYLGEAEPGADAVELTAETQYALTRASDDVPRVEVFTEGTPLGPYHEAALDGASLVWPAPVVPIRLARAFDGADPGDGPFFAAGHARLEGPDGERVLAYLRSAELVVNTPGAMNDVLDVSRVAAVPVGFRSDGEWVWSDAVAYYLKRHGLAPEPDLLAHILTRTSPPGRLSRLTRHRALATLFAPAEGGPVWQAG